MKRMFLRGKAIFQIFLIIVAFVYFSYVMKPVAASDVCCEKTLSGDYCFYGDSSNCDPAYQYAAVSCEQTSFCKLGCCSDLDEGICYKSTPQATCLSYPGGEWYTDETCKDVTTCQPGCCVIGTQCSFRTEQSCALETAEYPELEMIFHSDVTTESACQDICKAADQGCCINPDDSCVYEIRESCDAAGGDFYNEQYCSDVALCGCSEHYDKVCYDDDVYWVDSCGNMEEIAEDCDYASGTICRDVDGEKKCASVNCEDTYSDEKNAHDTHMGGFRKNGESWCVYESGAGAYKDRPGSRHYRHMCVSGEEIIESCRDYRDEICVQGEVEGYTESQCLHNDIYESPVEEAISTVPRGFNFWEEEGECSTAEIDCTVVWVKEDRFSSWECEENCQCETQDFFDDAAEYCKSLGDCGADLNIVGEQTTDGLVLAQRSREGPPSGEPSDVAWSDWSQYGVFGGMVGLFDAILEALATLDMPEIEGLLGLSPGMGEALIAGAIVAVALTAFSFTSIGSAFLAGGWVGLSGATSFIGPSVAGMGITVIGLIIVIIVIIIVYVIFGGGDVKEYHVVVECKPWVAPTGGDNCEACLDQTKVDELGFYDTCTEYKCKSLGLNCQYIPENSGTERVACYDSNPNDVNSPVISPWEEALTDGFSISTIDQGYEIIPDVPYYEKIEFGIQTNELAQCKISQEHTDSYEEMTSYFGDSYYQKEHNMTIIPQVGGQTYDYYVRCQDGSGNSNAAEYVIRFTTEDEPDLTAPNVEGTSIDDYGYVASNITEIGLALYLNEPSECKWSLTDQKYDTMENVTSCSDSPTNALGYDTYPCYTLLYLEKGLNTYYFRCEDKSENKNQNQQSYVYHLTSTDELEITSQGPEGTLYETTSPTLTVTTAGGAENGVATCYFSADETIDISLWPEFYNTDSTSHSQDLLNLAQGEHNYYVLCKDIAPNEAETTITFTIDKDTIAPEIEYIYIDNVALHVVLDEIATCEHANATFNYGEGTVMQGAGTTHHTVSVGEKYYYINCEDVYENHWNNPIIVYL